MKAIETCVNIELCKKEETRDKEVSNTMTCKLVQIKELSESDEEKKCNDQCKVNKMI